MKKDYSLTRPIEWRKVEGAPDDIDIRIKFTFDDDPDTSFMGEFCGDDGSEWIIDRKRGILLGDTITVDEDGVEVYAREEIPLNVHGDWVDRNAYGFWKPFDNHTPPGSLESWAHVSGEDRLRVIEQHGSLRQADINYITQDYQHCVDLHVRQQIWYEVLEVSLYCCGQEIDSDICSGYCFDGDKDGSDRESIIQEHISNLLHPKNLDKCTELLQGKINILTRAKEKIDEYRNTANQTSPNSTAEGNPSDPAERFGDEQPSVSN